MKKSRECADFKMFLIYSNSCYANELLLIHPDDIFKPVSERNENTVVTRGEQQEIKFERKNIYNNILFNMIYLIIY